MFSPLCVKYELNTSDWKEDSKASEQTLKAVSRDKAMGELEFLSISEERAYSTVSTSLQCHM